MTTMGDDERAAFADSITAAGKRHAAMKEASKEQQAWRIDCSESVASVTVWRSVHGVWTTGDGFLAVTPWLAVMSYAMRHGIIGTILAPGEPTRAELLARIAELEASR